MVKLTRFVTHTFLLTILFLFCSVFAFAADSDYIVKNLKIEDVPDDDGSGLQLSWEPLSKDKRIIEYRIYRGVSPDSLFYAGMIPVNAKIGVASDVMYYYDKGYGLFTNVDSPAKLLKEEKQDASSPLFSDMPKDFDVCSQYFDDYAVLAMIPKDNFYYSTTKVEKDGEVLAGLKNHQVTLLAKLKPGVKYYYTVLAINKQRKFFPHAEIVSGSPVENSPEVTKSFYPVYVKGMDRLQFEWTLPSASDIAMFSIYMVKNEDITKLEEFIDYNVNAEINPEKVEGIEPPQNPAQLIFRRNTSSYTSENKAIVNVDFDKIVNEDQGINVPVDTQNMDQYSFVMSLYDYSRNETFSAVKPVKVIDQTDLPVLPELNVADRPNDKGDRIQVQWGKPVVKLTNSTFLNSKKSKILVNYEYYTNPNYEEDKIKNIYFTVYDETGKEIETINEFFKDNKIKVTAPEGSDLLQKLTVKMTVTAAGLDDKDYFFTQSLSYSDEAKALRPGKLYFGKEKEDVDSYSYFLYKKAYNGAVYREVKRLSGTQRGWDDNVAYESNIYKPVADYDKKRKCILVDPTLTGIEYDAETGASLSTSIFKDHAAKVLTEQKEEIAKYKAQADTTTGPMKARIEARIASMENSLKFTENSQLLQAANKLGRKARVKMLAENREREKRTFLYKLVKTNKKGIFNETAVFEDEKGKKYFFPVSNWFDTEKVPMLIATLLFGLLVFIMIGKARKGEDLYIRPIAGIHEIDNAIGRATEMGRPILFVPGLSGINDVATLAALAILGRVAKKAAEYDTKILVPCKDYIVLPIAQEVVREAHYEAGRPDTFEKDSVFFITTSQFAFVAGVNGVMLREKTATNFYMGMFFAESLIMTETGSSTGAIQISGTDAVTQIPFFITTCDYTLIGEELYAAAAYLARQPLMLGTLKAQDYFKFFILFFIITGSLSATAHFTQIINWFPTK